MSLLPPIKRFLVEDYSTSKDISSFCGKFFYPLNLFLNATYSALQSGLTIQANMVGSITQNMAVTANSSGIASTTINWKFPQTPPVGVLPIACTLSGVAAPMPLTSWSYAAGVVTVTMQFTVISAGAVVQAAAGSYAVSLWVTGG